MITFANVIWGAQCRKSARWVLLGATRSRDHAHSVRRRRESALTRQAPHGLPPSRLVSTIRFDRWLQEKHRYCPFARYADDAVVHCSSQLQAQWKLVSIGKRLEECGLRLNLQKTAIVYCKDSQRHEAHAHKQFTFLCYTFRPREAKNRYGKLFDSFLPAVSLDATKKMLRTIKSLSLGDLSDGRWLFSDHV
jgi:RNA-directed DNA polymerase